MGLARNHGSYRDEAFDLNAPTFGRGDYIVFSYLLRLFHRII